MQSHKDEEAEAPEDNTAVDMVVLTLDEEDMQDEEDVQDDVAAAVLEVD